MFKKTENMSAELLERWYWTSEYTGEQQHSHTYDQEELEYTRRTSESTCETCYPGFYYTVDADNMVEERSFAQLDALTNHRGSNMNLQRLNGIITFQQNNLADYLQHGFPELPPKVQADIIQKCTSVQATGLRIRDSNECDVLIAEELGREQTLAFESAGILETELRDKLNMYQIEGAVWRIDEIPGKVAALSNSLTKIEVIKRQIRFWKTWAVQINKDAESDDDRIGMQLFRTEKDAVRDFTNTLERILQSDALQIIKSTMRMAEIAGIAVGAAECHPLPQLMDPVALKKLAADIVATADKNEFRSTLHRKQAKQQSLPLEDVDTTKKPRKRKPKAPNTNVSPTGEKPGKGKPKAPKTKVSPTGNSALSHNSIEPSGSRCLPTESLETTPKNQGGAAAQASQGVAHEKRKRKGGENQLCKRLKLPEGSTSQGAGTEPPANKRKREMEQTASLPKKKKKTEQKITTQADRTNPKTGSKGTSPNNLEQEQTRETTKSTRGRERNVQDWSANKKG